MCHYFSISNEASVVTVTFTPDSLNTGGRLGDEDKERARLPLTTRRSAKVIGAVRPRDSRNCSVAGLVNGSRLFPGRQEVGTEVFRKGGMKGGGKVVGRLGNRNDGEQGVGGRDFNGKKILEVRRNKLERA